MLSVELYALHKPAEWLGAVANVVFGALNVFAGVWTGGFANLYWGGAAGDTIKTLLDQAKCDTSDRSADEAQGRLIGVARFELDPALLNPGGGLLEAAFTCEDAVTVSTVVHDDARQGGEPYPQSTVVIAKGDTTGAVKIRYVVLA